MFTYTPIECKINGRSIKTKKCKKLFENEHSVNSDKDKNIEKWKREREKNKMNE